jgi:Putative metallopeptidase domain/VWA-like domain (DUF2201)
MPSSAARTGSVAEPQGLHRHRGTRAIQRLVEHAPSTGGLALWVAHRDLPDDPPADPPPKERRASIATDGHTVFYDAAFGELSLAEQTGLVAHEVLHIALRHPQRLRELGQLLGDVDAQLFNICADAIVNSALGHLGWLRLPAGGVVLERLLTTTLGGQHDAETALLAWDVERLYRAIDDRQPAPRDGAMSSRSSQGEGERAGRATGRTDGPRSTRARALGAQLPADLLPGPGGADDPQSQADEARTWSERILRAHTGDGAHSLLRTLVADLPRSHTPWEQVLRTQLTRSLSRKLAVSWSRPSRSYLANQGRCSPHRRMPFEPGVMPAQGAPRLVVVVDVSGSIDGDLLQRFAREIDAITRRLETDVTLVVGDDRVQRVERVAAGQCRLDAVTFRGGGGTDFTPLLEEADRQRPDLTVVLTDLDGPARYRPRAPVLWAVPEAFAAAVQPFGRKLSLR